MNEIADEIFVVDALGNLTDMGGDPASTPVLEMPTIDQGTDFRSRKFGDDIGLFGTEAIPADDELTLFGTVTVRAVLTYELANHAVSDIGTIIIQGLGGIPTADQHTWGLEIEKVSATTAKLRARWTDLVETVPAGLVGAVFTVPTGFFEVAMVREFPLASPDVFYYVNGELIGSDLSLVPPPVIGTQSSSGDVTIGCKGVLSGTSYENFLPDDSLIQFVSVENDAMTAEEIRQDYRRHTIYQPQGYSILRSYLPPGEAWSRNPDSNFQKTLRAEGDGLGDAISLAWRLREDHFVDRSYTGQLEAWERLARFEPGLDDTVQDRRDRLLEFFGNIVGYALTDIPGIFDDLLDQAIGAVDVREFTALFGPDPFTSTIADDYTQHDGNGTIAIVSSQLHIAATISTNMEWTNDAKNAAFLLRSVSGNAQGMDVSVLIDDWSVGASTDTMFGLIFLNAITEAIYVVGVGNAGAGAVFGDREFKDGVDSGVRTLVSSFSVDPVFVRATFNGDGDFTVRYGSSYDSITAEFTSRSGIRDVHFAGVGFVGPEGAGIGAAADADFDDLRIFEPNSRRTFAWFVYRDLALAGEPNLVRARAEFDRIKPAHTIGSVTTDLEFALGSSELGYTPYDIDP